MSRKSQQVALDWNETKPPAGEEPAWASFDYMKLRETLETIVAAMEASAREVEAPLSPEEAEVDSTLRLAVSNHLPPIAKSDS